MDEAALKAELSRLARWVEYLNEQRESHMTKITEFESALAKLSEAFTASVLKHDEEKAAWASERVVYEEAIDRSIEKVCDLYEHLTGRPTDEAAPVAADLPPDP